MRSPPRTVVTRSGWSEHLPESAGKAAECYYCQRNEIQLRVPACVSFASSVPRPAPVYTCLPAFTSSEQDILLCPPQLPSHMCPFCLESFLGLSSFTELILSFQNSSSTVSLGKPSTHPGRIRLPYPRLHSCCILVHLSLLPDNSSLKVGILIKRT